MKNYGEGKIYKLTTPHSDKYYIGSTVNCLCSRLANHKGAFLHKKKNTSAVLFEYEPEAVKIELLEAFPCKNNRELIRREGELQLANKSQIVNHNIAGRTQYEYKLEHQEAINKYRRQYYLDNREHLIKIITENKNRKKTLLKKV